MVISSSHAYAAFCAPYVDDATRSDAFDQWGAAQSITRATSPMVRGTRSLGGGLIPLCNAREIIDARVPDAVAPLPQGDAEWLAAPCVLATGVSLVKATDAAPVAPVAPVAPIRGSWLLKRNDLDLFAEWIVLTCARARRLGHL